MCEFSTKSRAGKFALQNSPSMQNLLLPFLVIKVSVLTYLLLCNPPKELARPTCSTWSAPPLPSPTSPPPSSPSGTQSGTSSPGRSGKGSPRGRLSESRSLTYLLLFIALSLSLFQLGLFESFHGVIKMKVRFD